MTMRSWLVLASLLLAGAPRAGAQPTTPNARLLDSIAGAGVAQGRTVGLVATVVRGADTLLLKSYGKADLEWDVPMPVDAMFEVGSLAKQFAAASILQLRDEGKLSLDDEVAKWVPQVGPNGAKITLRRLLSHTSGIDPFTEAGDWEMYMFLPFYPRDSAYARMKLEAPKFAPGEAQAYSNAGFWLLGAVVEKASGMKYEDYLATKIFTPLGMKRSMFCNSSANVPKRAHGYQGTGAQVRRAPMVNYGWVSAPGALCSTAGDLVIWLQSLHGGKVLSPKSYAEMTAPTTLNDGSTVMYGMGIKVGEEYRGLKYIGHGGTAPGFRAEAAWFPEGKLAVVVLMNTSPTNLSPGGVGGALARAVLPLPRPTFTFYTAPDASDFVGSYRYAIGGNQQLGTITVTSTPTGLAFSINGGRAEPLPWAGGLRFYAQETVTLTFRRANGDRGPVTEIRRDDMGNLQIFRKQ